MSKPNVLFIMTDQQRFDTIRALGNEHIYTPNLDRLVARGVSFNRGYSTCPVCMPARETIRYGCEPYNTRVFCNGYSEPVHGQAESIDERCGQLLGHAMQERGYRTFGVGKFHATPRFRDLGYQTHLYSEELWHTVEQREGDDYASYIYSEHPRYAHIEQLHGERSEMYYMPQMSPLPAELTVENWAADRTIELINEESNQPYFGFCSLIGPHPPLAPPVPFNRMYDPDKMPNRVESDAEIDHMDPFIPMMNHLVWAENHNDHLVRINKARYYGEITYIDQCIGKILDAVEARDDADNTLIVFYSDHGDHMGDHDAWQKESYFEQSCHVPYLVSWPAALPHGERSDDFACLTDLFAIATRAGGEVATKDGHDVLGALLGEAAPREQIVGMYGEPGSLMFKVMVRKGDWKYIYIANGGREQLFNIAENPDENKLYNEEAANVLAELKAIAIETCQTPGARDALEGETFKTLPYQKLGEHRLIQFDESTTESTFPSRPEDIL